MCKPFKNTLERYTLFQEIAHGGEESGKAEHLSLCFGGLFSSVPAGFELTLVMGCLQKLLYHLPLLHCQVGTLSPICC